MLIIDLKLKGKLRIFKRQNGRLSYDFKILKEIIKHDMKISDHKGKDG
jgi:hypothetical protein